VSPGTGAGRVAVLRALGLVVLAAACACAPARQRLAGEEAERAAAFFSRSCAPGFPFAASFSGTAEASGRAVPFVAGLRAEDPSRETAGVFDPLGRPVLYLENRGGRLSVRRAEGARLADEAGMGSFIRAGGEIAAQDLSLACLLSGMPAYPPAGGRLERGSDGGWVYADGRQRLATDPGRRAIVRAEYRIAGRLIAVTYAGAAGGPGGVPQALAIEGAGVRLFLRRDEE